MTTINHQLTESLIAIQDVLRKIAQLNNSIEKIQKIDPEDELSVQGLQRFKQQLTKDLAALLAEFNLNVKVESMAA